MEDLRKATRVPFSAPIEQILIYDSGSPKLGNTAVFNARTLDISLSGISFETKTKIDPASMVYFIFSVPTVEGNRRIGCDGYVAFSKSKGTNCIAGIHFVDITQEDSEVINTFIESHR